MCLFVKISTLIVKPFCFSALWVVQLWNNRIRVSGKMQLDTNYLRVGQINVEMFPCELKGFVLERRILTRGFVYLLHKCREMRGKRRKN